MKNINSVKVVVDILNDAYNRDPVAVLALLTHKTPCNDALADHPSVVVAKENLITPMGLLNGIIQDLTGDKVAMVYDDTDTFLRFAVYNV